MQLVALVKRPYFSAIIGDKQFWSKAAKVRGQIVHVAHEHTVGTAIASGVYGLGQVNDDKSVAAGEYVVLTQIAVDGPLHGACERPV